MDHDREDWGPREYALGKGEAKGEGEGPRDLGLPDWGDPPAVEEDASGAEVFGWALACVLIGAAVLFLYGVSLWDPAEEAKKPPSELRRLLRGE